MTGARSLVNATYEIARALINLDTHVEDLIDAMNGGSQLAKEYAPVNGPYSPRDVMVCKVLRDIIRGANIIKVYCENRPEGTHIMESCLFLELMMSQFLLELSAIKTIGADLAWEIDDCFHALSESKGRLVTQIEPYSLIETEHMETIIKSNGKGFSLCFDNLP